jgi:hypothetical protein
VVFDPVRRDVTTGMRAQVFHAVWQTYASRIEHAEGFNCGHYITEEIPDTLYDRCVTFFV